MEIRFNRNNISKDNYNFIISNLLLSKKEDFTYEDCVKELTIMLGVWNSDIENALSRALIRLRDDGFLNVLGENYKVV